MKATYIDADEVERTYRAMASKNIEDVFAGRHDRFAVIWKQATIDILETQVAFQRCVVKWQNGDVDTRIAGFVSGMSFGAMARNLLDNITDGGVARSYFWEGLRQAFDDTIPGAERGVVEPVAGGLS